MKSSNEYFDSDEFKFVKQFDTIQMLIGLLIREFDCETQYPIKGADIKALVFIGIFPNKSMSFYSMKLNMEQGSFNYIANKFVKLGLVEIVKSDSDKRKKVFILTEKGEKETTRIRKEINTHISEKFSIFSDEELELFFTATEYLRNIAERIKKENIKNKEMER